MATRHSRSARDQAALCELWGMLNASVSVGKLSGAADVLELEGNSGLPGDHSSAVRGWSEIRTRGDAKRCVHSGLQDAVLAVAERFDLIAR